MNIGIPGKWKKGRLNRKLSDDIREDMSAVGVRGKNTETSENLDNITTVTPHQVGDPKRSKK